MKHLFSLSLLLFSFNVYGEFDTKCSILITKRLQSAEDAYKDAISKIEQCQKNDIISVTSFLEKAVSKIYITDIIQSYCMFNHEIISLLDKNTSNLSCVHRGLARNDRKFIIKN